jgi:LuxR family maltose regulon positive regulatory protein
MSVALVETKFFLPYARDGLLPRPRLDLVLRARRTRLTLVSAPAGFGKTTLLATWLTASGGGTPDCAWVSLDESDREATTFWTYVLTALDRAAPSTGVAALGLLGAGQPIEVVLTAVLNELSVLPGEVHLVLDDYHLAESPGVQTGMAFLLERLPPQLRLVISTRADPALPLARLRARGELTEVRVADLRFTDDETGAFLATATGLELDPADVTALGARTEGWIASLQLAALSLRDRVDPARFIAGFAGDDRYIVDYLVEEVLDQLPAELRDFLIATAILDRLTGPLCDAVTGTTGGAQTLELLERRNLFVVPLDDQRRWYRYHHLFADVLRSHLLAQHADVPELHRRASRWYAEAGAVEDAVRHAVAAGEIGAAAELVELALPELRRDRREGVIRRWVDQLPVEVVDDRPLLAAGFIGALMACNEFDAVGPRLGALRDLLERPASELIVVDTAELPRLPGVLESWSAGLALVGGDLAGTIAHADRALTLAADGDHVTTAAGAALSGLAHWAGGDVVAAHRRYETATWDLERAGHIADVLGCSLAVADMELTLGRLVDSARTLERALELAERHGPPPPDVMRGTPDMLVGLSRAAWHRNDLVAAGEFLRRAEELGEAAGLPQHPYRWRVAMARLRAADGAHGDALELLDEAERVYVADFSPQIHPIHATRARVLLASGDVAGAATWAREHHLDAGDELSYLREYEHLTLARVLLAERRPAALPLLNRLLAAAEAGGRGGSVIDVELLRSAALRASGSVVLAVDALEHAVELAETEGRVRVFVDAGPAVADSLRELALRSDRPFVAELLQAIDGIAATAPAPPRPVTTEPFVDPLSDRELDVLRLLGSDLDGPGIARELVVSLNTVRTHTKHIYTKLGVNNRRSAISRAHQLGLMRVSGPPAPG